MKKSSGITPGKGHSSLYRKMVNKFVKSQEASKQENARRNGKKFSSCYEVIECSSDTVLITGRLEIRLHAAKGTEKKRIRVPIQSSFLVTGFWSPDGNYQMTWANSMC